jgi:hypothetical protein
MWGERMSEVLRTFTEPIRDESGEYHGRVVGRQAADGMWEGWMEFIPLDGVSEALVSPAESRQPEHAHLAYWASGLSVIYAEGALKRARRPPAIARVTVEIPLSDAPAPRVVTAPPRVAGPEPVLDPFEIGGRSLDILRQELRAIGRARLLNIIAAYDLNPGSEDIQQFTEPQLIAFIATAVEHRLLHRAR